METILVVGGGFAGLAATQRFYLAGGGRRVILLDPRAEHHFLPLLPDVVGRGFDPDHLRYPYADWAARWSCEYRREPATHVDLEARILHTPTASLPYDGLLLCTGTETDFHGQDPWREKARVLDSVEDAVAIRDAALAAEGAPFLVVGGGYTGVELATNLRRLRARRGQAGRILLVTSGRGLCPYLSQSFQDYLARQVTAQGVEPIFETRLERFDGETPVLTDGQAFPDALVFWTAGVRTGHVVRALPCARGAQERLVVDPALRIHERAFAAGDAAGFQHRGAVLRLGIQFSISEGWHAAGNLLRVLNGRAPKPFRPLDPGYVVPMANFRGCGAPMGLPLTGRAPVLLHYFMSVLRSYGLANRWGVVRDLLRGDRRG